MKCERSSPWESDHHVSHNEQPPHRTINEAWPSAVGWLAVAAHVSVAVALWRTPTPARTTFPHCAIAIVVLMAQADLLTVWLLVGTAPWPRRLAWTMCGWSGIAFALSSGARFGSANFFPVAVQPAVAGAVLLYLRLRGLRLIPAYRFQDSTNDLAIHRQFSILELLGSALGVAIAAALFIRIDDFAPFRLHNRQHEVFTVLLISLPMALFTLASTRAMRPAAGLLPQVLLAGVAVLLAIVFPLNRIGELWLIQASHWLAVAATLAVFERCGHRLVRLR